MGKNRVKGGKPFPLSEVEDIRILVIESLGH
jgi:hypothetical protein